MTPLVAYLQRVSRKRMLVAGAAFVVVTVYFDWITGPTVSLNLFYVLPVGLLTWYLGKRWAYALAGLASLLWLWIDVFGKAFTLHSPQLYWNTIVRFGMMVVVAKLVEACKNLTGEIEKLVEARTALLEAELESRKRAEEAMRVLATRVSEAEEAERRRLAHDLHDSIGQDLTALRLTLEATAERGAPNVTGQAGLTEACRITDRVIQQTRGLTRDLYPAMLDDFGMVPTLRGHVEQYTEQTGIQISVNETGEPWPLPKVLASFLFRAIKELINNAAKHGPARQVVIALHWREDRVRVVVDDDGRGFTPGAEASRNGTGLGLSWIRERVETLGHGGTMELECLDGGGGRVILTVPLAAKETP